MSKRSDKEASIKTRLINLGIPPTPERIQVSYENETASEIKCYRLATPRTFSKISRSC